MNNVFKLPDAQGRLNGTANLAALLRIAASPDHSTETNRIRAMLKTEYGVVVKAAVA